MMIARIAVRMMTRMTTMVCKRGKEQKIGQLCDNTMCRNYVTQLCSARIQIMMMSGKTTK
jgi:hypothetical protein